MAFGFKYKVTVVVTHPSLIVDEISGMLPTLTPTTKINAGENRQLKSGKTRVAELTVWEAPLHTGQLDSEVQALDDFLERASDKILAQYQGAFLKLRKCGSAILEVCWYNDCDSTHSVGLFSPDALKAIAATGLVLDIEFFCSGKPLDAN